jgi:hypothetical protein
MRKTKIKSTAVKGVDPEVFKCNYDVIRLVLYGFSTAAIARKTGLTIPQVTSRVRMYNMQGIRSKFRHGETQEAIGVSHLALTVTNYTRKQDTDRYQDIRDNVLTSLRKHA